MTRPNPFDGKEAYARFAWAVYSRMTGRGWFSLADVMTDHLSLKSAADLPCLVSKCDKYGELKKAFRDIVHLLEGKVGPGCVETEGNNRCKRFRYVGIPDNPLEDMQNAEAIKDIKRYAQFCQDSAGFFPTSWIEYFFEDTLDLLDIKKQRKDGLQSIVSSLDRELTNIEMLPMLYEFIRDKKVLSISYRPYGEEAYSLIFHPHLLKEYNGRWFLFGHAENHEPEYGYNLALDRIEQVAYYKDAKYIGPPRGFYAEFFKDIVGVSHYKNTNTEEIIIKARSLKMFNLINTKRIHRSQEIVKPFERYEDGEYGLIKVRVKVNNEFLGRILQMGPRLEIMAPDYVRKLIKERVIKMAETYGE